MTLQELDTHQDQVDQELVWIVSQVIAHVPGKVNLDNMTFLDALASLEPTQVAQSVGGS